MNEAITIGLDLAKNVFRCMASMPREGLSSAGNSDAVTYFLS